MTSTPAPAAPPPGTASALPAVDLLVVSCDAYQDLWPLTFALLRRFWPTCPLPVHLLTNQARPHLPGVAVVAVGPDRGWSANLLAALDRLEGEYVLLLLEDLLLTGPVDGDQVRDLLAWTGRHRPHHLRLVPSEPANRPFDDRVGEVLPGAPYRTTTVASLWRRETLRALLRPEESAWAFELAGSERSDAWGGFYATWVPVLPLLNAVVRGRWLPGAVARVRSLGLAPDLQARPVLAGVPLLRFRVLQARHALFRLVPWRARRRVRSWLRGGTA